MARAPGALGLGPRRWSAGRGCRWSREGQGLARAWGSRAGNWQTMKDKERWELGSLLLEKGVGIG